MQALEDHFIVALSELENTKIKSGSLELEAATFLKPLKFARTYGRVVSVPSRLSSDNRYNLNLKEWGFPVPKMGIGSDWIQQRNNYGEKGIDRSWYSIAGAQPQYKVMSDYRWYEGMVEEGDMLYFHYRANSPENIVHQENGETWIKVRFDQCICFGHTTKKGKRVVWPLAEHVLAQPISESWDDITNGLGLILSAAPKNFPNICKLTHVHFLSQMDGLEIGEGSTIVVHPSSLNFEMEIEGTKYFIMKERELHMKVENGVAKPIGDRVVLKPDSVEDRTKSGIIIPDTALEKSYIAEVLAVGSKIEEPEAITVGSRVLYAKDSGIALEYNGEKILIVRESDIACTI